MTTTDSLAPTDRNAAGPTGDLASLYRPRRFDQVLGQLHVKRPLAQMLVDGRLPPTLLFSGPPGTGKTSVARIVAASLVCSDRRGADACGACASCAPVLSGRFSLPVWEINSARDGGIDDVRRLQDHLDHAHQWHQVVLWDEAHRITREACDALLKTLEETPDATFILITTDPLGLPPTVRSRSTQFLFERIATSEITAHLSKVASDRSWQVSKSTVRDIAAASDGSPRKALQLLGLAVNGGRVPREDRIRELATHLVASGAGSDFMRAHAVLDELLGLAEPPSIRDACTELVFEALSGATYAGGRSWRRSIDGLPEEVLAAIGAELSRSSIPRGAEGAAALKGLVMSVASISRESDATSGPERLHARTPEPDGSVDLDRLNQRCPTPQPSGLRRPLKNGRRVPLKPCDHADCEVCAPEVARDYIEVLPLAGIHWSVLVAVPLERLKNSSRLPRDRLNDIVGKARLAMGDIEWAWYAEEDGRNIKLHAVARFRSGRVRTRKDIIEDLSDAFGRGSKVSILPIEDSHIDTDFLGQLAHASSETREEAARRVAAHVKWNGGATLHTSKMFWLDEAGRPFGPPSPKDKAQKLGRRRRSERGQYGVMIGPEQGRQAPG